MRGVARSEEGGQREVRRNRRELQQIFYFVLSGLVEGELEQSVGYRFGCDTRRALALGCAFEQQTGVGSGVFVVAACHAWAGPPTHLGVHFEARMHT